MEFTAIDFETANESRASACAIGIVVVSNGEIIEQAYHLIRPPELYFNPHNIQIHGITKKDVFDKPTFDELWPSIKHYFENRLVIAHNASFDMSVMRSTLDYYSIPYPELRCGCTLIMSRKHWPDRRGHGLNVIADLLNIEFQHHHAMEDSLVCAQIALYILNSNQAKSLKELSSILGFSYGSFVSGFYHPPKQSTHPRPIAKEKSPSSFTKKGEIDKAVHKLEGLIKGIAIDGIINTDEAAEVENWYQLHQHLLKHHPLSELVVILEDALTDGFLSVEEKIDILWVCNNYTSKSIYYDLITSDIQRLHGLLHGILADNKLEIREVEKLEEWLSENTHLRGVYPYDELYSLLTVVVRDGMLTSDEINMLKTFFSEFIDTRTSYNLNDYELQELRKNLNITGICAVHPSITFQENIFCFTGESSRKTRAEIKNLIESVGGRFKNSVVKDTSYLIVGNEGNPAWAFSCYGRKVEQAVNLRKAGKSILIIHENDFWNEIDGVQKG